jgi:hypothetical protein
MTFPFYKSSLNYEESELASLILDNFNLKRDLADFDYFKSLEVSKEIEIELSILSIAILCIHRPNFISDEDADRIEQTCLEVIVWMAGMYPQKFSTIREGQLYHAKTKLDTYKKELLSCLRGEEGGLPWNIYSGIFHFPLQSKIVEENHEVLARIKSFNSTLKWLIPKYTEASFECFATLTPDIWWYSSPSSKEDLLQHKEKFLCSNKWFDYKRERAKLYEKYNKLTSSD